MNPLTPDDLPPLEVFEAEREAMRAAVIAHKAARRVALGDRVTVLFEEFDGRTTLTVTTVFDTVAMKEEYLGLGMSEGMQSGFDQLVDVVEDLKAWELK